MINSLIAIVGRLGLAIANHLWQSTGFAVLIWLLTLLLKTDRARVRHLLWFAASAKFLLPFSLLVGLGSLSARLQPNVLPARTAFSATVAAVGQPFSDRQQNLSVIYESARKDHSNWLASALALVWLLGSATVVAIWAVRCKRVAGVLRNAVPSNQGIEVDALRRLETVMGSPRRIALLRTTEMSEPCIFGIIRPVLLWPERLTERLRQENVEAILTHELMHVRRLDNLTAAIHMAVEAIFWFHPMVWWIGSRMLEEREHACDEAAVQQASKPEIYAESLLTACRFCVESPVTCISGITGADLKARILRIMSNRVESRMSIHRKIVLVAAAFTCVGVPVALGMFGVAQDHAETAQSSASALPKFDVASIKPHKDNTEIGVMIGMRFTPDGVTISGMPLDVLLRHAFGISEDRVQNAPAWAKSERFDIDAKVDATDVAALGKLKMEDRGAMLLPLLEDRFGLKYHHETKELQVYTLVVAKSGPKLTESKPVAGDANAGPQQMMRMSGEGMSMESKDGTMDTLAHAISMQLGATVVDKTGLTGHYDYTLKWVPEQGMPMMSKGPGGGPEPGGGAPTSPTGPSLVTALQEQLGLKLETKKEPVDVIVIDQINQPSPN